MLVRVRTTSLLIAAFRQARSFPFELAGTCPTAGQVFRQPCLGGTPVCGLVLVAARPLRLTWRVLGLVSFGLSLSDCRTGFETARPEGAHRFLAEDPLDWRRHWRKRISRPPSWLIAVFTKSDFSRRWRPDLSRARGAARLLAVMASSRQHLDALTGLRFLAAAHVVAYHVYHLVFTGTEAPPGLHGLLDSGYVSIGFFFVLSGFLLGYHHLERPPDSYETRKAFWVARFARIYPVYALGLVLDAPSYLKGLRDAWTVDPWRGMEHAEALVLTPLLLQSWTPWTAMAWNGSGWPVAVGAFFCAAFPFLAGRLGLLGPKALGVAAAVAYAASLVLPALYMVADPDHTGGTASAYNSGPWMLALRFNPLARLPEFILGILAARGFLLRAHAPSHPVALAAVGGLIILALLGSPWLPFPLLHNGLLAPVFAVLFILLSGSQGAVARALASRPLRILGESSYALFLLHMPVLFAWKSVLKRLGEPPTSAWAVAVFVVGSVILSVLAHQRVQKPARAWIRERRASRRSSPGAGGARRASRGPAARAPGQSPPAPPA
ncbi:acyltransferase [Corallococcus sp. AB049A]|nr:acyltransferase [Corallococcus sp. AB049A]